MKATAWKNGRHDKPGVEYGLRISSADRDRYFNRAWSAVRIELPCESGVASVVVNIDKDSFWLGSCRELIDRGIGAWLRERGHVPWPSGKPPHFKLELARPGVFIVRE
jgi:hypothetical protein